VEIHRATSGADVVVNFLDLVGGISRWLFRPEGPSIAIAHNHLFAHPALARHPGRPWARRLVRLYTDATALRSRTRVALSFGPLGTDVPGLVIAPPLLRPGLDSLAVRDGGYLLTYALNAGYADLIAGWAATREDVDVHCYVDGGATVLRRPAPPRFRAHDLDPGRFLEHLAGCRAYAGSAGFESLCEAFHLGKPVLAVPTDGQLEQRWNAWDAERAGAARGGSWGDLDALWDDPPAPDPERVRAFRAWVAGAASRHVEIVERVAFRGSGGRAG
jgi:hypothetical protein